MQNIVVYKESYQGEFRVGSHRLVKVSVSALDNTAARYEVRVEYGGDLMDQVFSDSEANCSKVFQRIMLWPRIEWDDLRGINFVTV